MIHLRPSSSSIWTKCTAMPRLAAMVPEIPPTDAAREGTCAAWVAEMLLRGEYKSAHDMVDLSHENGWVVNTEMSVLIQRYVDLLRSRGGEIHVEKKVNLNRMISGTPDGYAVFTGTGELFVDDLKYGYMGVEVYKNTQLAIYAAAIIKLLTAKGHIIRKVQLGIYQPRSMHPDGIYRKWSLYPEELMKFSHWIESKGRQCQQTASVAVPGDHCKFCPAASICSAVTGTIYAGFQKIEDSRHFRMTNDQLAQELSFLNTMSAMVEGRRSAVENEATVRAQKGEYVPGYGFQQTFGQRRFKVTAGELALRTGLNPYGTAKIATPLEMERRGADPDVIEQLTEKPPIKAKLKKLPDGYFEQIFKPAKSQERKNNGK